MFEKWLRTVCFQEPTREACGLAKCAWNEAIRQAAERVKANYDPDEPWIEPSEIEDLRAER